MDIDQLRTFVTVAKARHFGRAAMLLNLTQPTVSNRIKALERELGQRLLKRHNQLGVDLSAAGNSFFPYAQHILELADEGTTIVDTARSSGQFIHLATTTTLAENLTIDFLPQMAALCPDAQLRIATLHSIDIFSRLAAGHFDFGLMQLFGTLINPPANIQVEQLFRFRIALVVSRNHVLATMRSVNLQDLDKEQLILYERSIGYESLVVAPLRRLGIKLHILAEVNNVRLISQWLRVGRAIAFLPEFAIQDDLERGDLVRLRVVNLPVLTGCTGLAFLKLKNTTIPVSDAARVIRECVLAKHHTGILPLSEPIPENASTGENGRRGVSRST
jgi:LysR family transcriptional regulator, low CO2-responsive transcriptional regulator